MNFAFSLMKLNCKHLLLVGTVSFFGLSPASIAEFCTPNTRCTDYSRCYINNVAQSCAYGSGGATYGGVNFKHGIFEIEWISETRAKVTYGKRKEFKATARVSVKNGYRILSLSDGVVVEYPVN